MKDDTDLNLLKTATTRHLKWLLEQYESDIPYFKNRIRHARKCIKSVSKVLEGRKRKR